MKFSEDEGAEGEEGFHLSEGMIILHPKAVEKLKQILEEACEEYKEKKESL